MEKMSEIQIKVIMEQLLLALDFIHSKGIAHRDIKPDNILIGQDTLKICDFGSAKYLPSHNVNLVT